MKLMKFKWQISSIKRCYSDMPSATPLSSQICPSALKSRLEQHYYKTVMEDVMILNYNHESPMSDLKNLESCSEWHRSLPESHLEELYSIPLEKLPTQPFNDMPTTHLMTLENSTIGEKLNSRRYKKRLYNPIDYTIVKKDEWSRDDPPRKIQDYSPLPSRTPIPKKVILKIWSEAALKNKTIILSAIMSLEAISGVKAEPLFAEFSDAQKGIREGFPMGARVEIKGENMFHFLDKMTQCVLPRLREWDGINPSGNDEGAIAFTLPSSSIGYFPDIEPHFDSYPRLFDVDVLIYTTGRCDKETVLCLSGLQIPFKTQPDKIPLKHTENPWKKYTREMPAEKIQEPKRKGPPKPQEEGEEQQDLNNKTE